ncbi:MAG: gamma-glutamyltransferase [Pirellulaceae bacterium]
MRELLNVSMLLLVALVSVSPDYTFADEATCVIASVQPIATNAGINAYQSGGNAVDAAIATAVMLGVVDNHNSGLGGGCFILIRTPDGQIHAIDGREMAPAAATAKMYLRDGKADTGLSQTGPLAIAVPGALAAYAHALRSHGKKELADVMLPAAKVAEEGFEIDEVYAQKLASKKTLLAKFPASSAQLLKPNGDAYAAGEVLRQVDLATTYRNIAQHGEQWFYEGDFAKTVDQWMKDNGGILTANDFANYRIELRQPVVTDYRQWKIVGFPPPSSGGCHVAQMLNILETFDLAGLHQRDPAQAKHIVIEAMKRAFADRAFHLGDADFAKVPKALIDKEYARFLADQIDPTYSTDVPNQGDPFAFGDELFGKHTTHIAAADSDGNWVAITATVNTTFGSKVIVPGTGLILNNEMDDFSAQPGVPNAFGLIGAENNAIAPGKRPLSSMSPTLVLDRRAKPIMTVGAAGGPKIITQVLLALIRTLDYGQDLQTAVAGPRFHHQWRPDSVLVESTMDANIVSRLKDYGHTITSVSSSGITQAIELDDAGHLIGVHDPRIPGKVGYGFRKTAAVEK